MLLPYVTRRLAGEQFFSQSHRILNNGDFISIYTSQEGGVGVGVTVPVVGQECGSLCVDSKLLPQFYTATTNSRKAGKYQFTMSPKGEPEILRYQHQLLPHPVQTIE